MTDKLDRRAMILAGLESFAKQRPGLEFGNYGDISAYRSELRSITRDLQHARALLAAVGWRESIGADELIAAAHGAYSGRLQIKTDESGAVTLNYCTGQYWPTEYRRAVCAVLASALWDYWRDNMPAPTHFVVDCIDGDWRRVLATSRKFATREEAETYAATVATSRHPGVTPIYDGLSAGGWIRRTARRELGAGIARRWFN